MFLYSPFQKLASVLILFSKSYAKLIFQDTFLTESLLIFPFIPLKLIMLFRTPIFTMSVIINMPENI